MQPNGPARRGEAVPMLKQRYFLMIKKFKFE